jgi:hypothetical protein
MNFSFRKFVEEKENKEKPENYIDGMFRELGIDRNSIPDNIESGPIEVDGILYNQGTWRILKPIDPHDVYVKMVFTKFSSPNLDQHAYRRSGDGKLTPYEGKTSGNVHLVPIAQLAEMLSRAWQTVVAGGGAGGGMGGPLGGAGGPI